MAGGAVLVNIWGFQNRGILMNCLLAALVFMPLYVRTRKIYESEMDEEQN
jgi:hypothetical protein